MSNTLNGANMEAKSEFSILPFDPLNDIVLVIDDSRAFRTLIKRNLAEIGVSAVLEAEDGLAATALVLHPAIRHRLRLILCDIIMPVMDGYEFVRRLKALPASEFSCPGRNIPVLVVSSEHSEADVREAMASGVNGFIVKPVDTATLFKRINILIEQGVCRFTGEKTHRPKPSPTLPEKETVASVLPRDVVVRPVSEMKVIVVDDSPAVTRLLAMYLRKIGIVFVQELNDSERAMDLMAENDLIITDIMMPGKSGFDLVRHLRSQPEPASSIPVMAVSSLRDIDKIAELMSYGIDEYLAKPFSQTDFEEKFISVIRKRGIFGIGR
ncbi:MAG: hypothetical protein CVV64_11240 [Candidatus Wallbacteria bacterium HGW-Wallbacteria-1]|jgi:CheY-like chemotaxis protein|uniref:Response regulatory domain-containing protein n=1 Tax=Candidatus Wallbacteria bacterium HGW-Wallbacteria-1 TaxID=2013854 RepID=A0A2N1PP17_9BACT|nr:MAG: hypothetical protein CVV64_11240 [Candidatus Wallbacteria bacterium HGW-Wallbacteria-1]